MVIDGVAVHFDNRATSALFRYTPHLHGNENFVDIYNRYKTYRPPATYDARLLRQSPRANYTARPGQRIRMVVTYRNTGTATWLKTGSNPMSLGNSSPSDRRSAFTAGENLRWQMSQSVVRRNGAGTFIIWFTAPSTPGTYTEKFRPVMEGVTWMGNEVTFNITVGGTPVNTKSNSKSGSTPVKTK